MATEVLAAPWADRPTGGTGGRVRGLDVARAIAFGGMLLAHYASAPPASPGWLRAIDAAADGRAAPLFCVLAGVGAGLLSARGRDRELVARGLVLVAVGVLVWPYVQAIALILPHYGVLLVTVPLLRRLPTSALLPSALVAFLVPTVAGAFVADDRLRSVPQPASWSALADLGSAARLLMWTGAYPLVGWVGFTMVGLWLSRQRLHSRAVRWWLLAAGLAVALTQPALALVADVSPSAAPGRSEGWATFLDATAHSNRLLWYVVASATAVAVIAGCLLVVDGSRVGGSAVSRTLASLGQLALSAYLAHIVLGVEVVWPWRDRTAPSLPAQMVVVGLVFVAFGVAARLWRARFARGPAESVVRAAVRPLR